MIESVLGKSVAANLSTGGTVDGDLTVTGSLGVGGDASINLTSVVSNSTIIDATGTEAFLVRANSDGGDTLIVDTTNSRVGINKTPTNVLNIFRDDSSTVGTNDVVIENDGAGDASLKFSLTGATDWFAYVDNSDSDKFKIRRSTSDYLEIDESGNSTFSGNINTGKDKFLRFQGDSSGSDASILFADSSGTGGSLTFKRNADSASILTLNGDKSATFSSTITATAEIISQASLQVQTGGGTAIGSITSSSGDLVIDGDSSRDIVLQSSGGNVGIGGAPSNLFDLIKDGTDGGETKFLRMLDADTDTTADTEMIIAFQKYSDGTSAVDVGSIGMGVSGWGTVSSN